MFTSWALSSCRRTRVRVFTVRVGSFRGRASKLWDRVSRGTVGLVFLPWIHTRRHAETEKHTEARTVQQTHRRLAKNRHMTLRHEAISYPNAQRSATRAPSPHTHALRAARLLIPPEQTALPSRAFTQPRSCGVSCLRGRGSRQGLAGPFFRFSRITRMPRWHLTGWSGRTTVAPLTCLVLGGQGHSAATGVSPTQGL